MTAAGVVEFAPAFALGWAPLARAAALVFCGMFVSAIVELGKIDAIGHAPIIAFLIAVFADGDLRAQRSPVIAPAWCALAIAGLSRHTTLQHCFRHRHSVTGCNEWRGERAAACDFAGIHRRSDAEQGMLLGEAVAWSILSDQSNNYSEEDFDGFVMTELDGTTVKV